ncbi:MAG: ribosome-associated protein [Planctomycetota bacterium]|jgi:ribosome-associated protein
MVLKDGRVIPKECFAATFSRSGGAGGQHVNKTESRVDLRLDFEPAREVLGDHDVTRIKRALASRLDAEGRLMAVSSEHKSQFQNYRAAVERMAAWIAQALVRQKRRIKTKPTRGSKMRRLDEKKRRGDIKKGRQSKPERD